MGNFSYGLHTGSMTVAFAPLWTVSLEEQFYIFWPILLFILLPRDKKWFFIALGGLVVLSIAVRFYIFKNHIPYPFIWVFTLARLDPFALGAVMSYLYLNPRIKPHPVLALCAAILIFKAVISLPSIEAYSGNAFWQLFAVDFAACLLIYTALYSNRLGKLLSIRVISWLGKISFGLYVFHDLMIQVTFAYIMPYFLRGQNFGNASLKIWCLFFIITLSLTIACAALSYYGFERHFLKWKTRFTVIASRPA
ncbi:MAG TPA: acyltransferase [Gammaproteobacteria bacterium]|nr:acyltransferase [Gammaproteobacteria bacterium]